MNKPLTVARYDLINAICDAINNSGLPAFVVVECLERILNETKNIADAEYQRDLQLYKEGSESK